MRAALLETSAAPLALVDDIDVAEPRPGEVRVRVSHCGVCHSDLSIVERHLPECRRRWCSATRPRASSRSVGAGVPRCAPGDKVVLTPIAACDECYWCLRGEYGCCVNALAVTTGTSLDGHTPLSRNGAPVLRGLGVGGFAELVVTPASGAVKVADDTPLEVACVIGCAVQTGVGAVLNTARVEPGATVLVIGAGGVGIAIAQGARGCRCARAVIVSDPVADRRDAALRFGATDVIDPECRTTSSPPCHALTGGIGVDYAFEAVGSAPLVESCLFATRNGGTTVMVGAAPIDQACHARARGAVHDRRSASSWARSSARATAAATCPACSTSGARVGSTSKA